MLVEPSLEYREDAINYVRESLESDGHCNGVGGLHRYLDNYEGWLEYLEYCRNYVADNERVPSLEYLLVRESDNRIVGMINIRLSLNESLERLGGHIGYSIRPSERRQGYNRINLYLALLICREHGIDRVVLDCNRDNLGSSRSMMALGGRLIREWVDEREGECQRYEINVPESLEENEERYRSLILR
jgi:predicted acetyltransferase